MNKPSLIARLALPLLLAGGLLAGCAAGITPQQRQTDSEVDYGHKEQKLLAEKRMEFDQLVEDFLLLRNPVFLDRMAGVLERTDKEIGKARVFLDLQPPYHRGIALARRQAAEQAVRTGEKELCDMMLAYGELHIRYGDPVTARGTLKRVLSRFPGDSFTGYRAEAEALLEEGVRAKADQDAGTVLEGC